MAVEIRRNVFGAIEEIMARHVTLHLEQTGLAHWSLIVDAANGQQWVFGLAALLKKTSPMGHILSSHALALDVTVQEHPSPGDVSYLPGDLQDWLRTLLSDSLPYYEGETRIAEGAPSGLYVARETDLDIVALQLAEWLRRHYGLDSSPQEDR